MNRLFFLSLFLGILSVELRGELTLHPLIGNHAVFQRDVPFPVIGKADSGAEVVVQWRGKDYQAKAGADGKWSLQLDPSPATEKGQVLKVKSGTNSIEVSDILIGEVWLASGQSNMEWPLNKCGAQMAEAESAEDPHLRLAWVSRATAPLPAESVKTSWRSATKSTALTFSAVGYFFGRELRKTTQVPVGVIQSAVGGTPAEAWTPIEFLEAESDFAKAVNSRKEYPNWYPKLLAKYEKDKVAYDLALAEAEKTGAKPPKKIREPHTPEKNPNLASVLWNGMIYPLVPYPIRGVIWYQGESNAYRAEVYEKLLTGMIGAWRKAWGQGDFPFLIVQLTDFNVNEDGATGVKWAKLRDAQSAVADHVPQTGLAVTLGLGDAEDIHPQRKMEVGERLALWANKIAYGKDVVCQGPVFNSVKYSGAEAIVSFRPLKGELKSSDQKEVGGFAVAGSDKQFKPAQARLEKNQVILKSSEVAKPAFVRYAWCNRPADANLTDESNLPARPFRTDTD
ncbi:MAG: sialate O-acetylesterase [Verrucomicrobia bacterium]|nr:sialate O-acetylesterase [Verrucomicrobiota bacterium]MDA0858061.1 sialate O-acetylesterase [Verrucomicrobiota bacterium]